MSETKATSFEQHIARIKALVQARDLLNEKIAALKKKVVIMPLSQVRFARQTRGYSRMDIDLLRANGLAAPLWLNMHLMPQCGDNEYAYRAELAGLTEVPVQIGESWP